MAAHLEELFRVQATAKGIRLEVVIHQDLDPRRMGDAARINQVLMNLLSNAIKFTGEGEVSLWIGEAGPGVVLFRVKDTGIGIPAGKLDSIFDPFTQAESSLPLRDFDGQLPGTFHRENVRKEMFDVERKQTRFRGCGRSPEGD